MPSCLFLNMYYPDFLREYYLKHNTAHLPYSDHLASLRNARFGDSDFYSYNLAAVGWETDDLIINSIPLQTAWARENKISSQGLSLVLEQIASIKPDVVYFQDFSIATKDFLSALRSNVGLIVGQIASPIPDVAYLRGFDCIISSFPHFVERFRREGIAAYFQPLSFEPRILDELPHFQRDIACSFVGGISHLHTQGSVLLEHLARSSDIQFWGYGAETLPQNSAIRQKHHGESWGKDMFGVLRRSKITVNRHIEIAGHYANNMRLFEATGCGALLLTDAKNNLGEFFEIGKEIVAYNSPAECAELVNYYEANSKEAVEIAAAGQRRTLAEHNYSSRMKQTAVWLERHLKYKREARLYAGTVISEQQKKQLNGNAPTNLRTTMETQAKPPYPIEMQPTEILQRRAGAFLEHGQKLMKAGNFEEALKSLDDAMINYSQLPNVQYLRSICLWRLGRVDEAFAALSGEIKVAPNNQQALYAAAMASRAIKPFIESANIDLQEANNQIEMLRKFEFKIYSQSGEDGVLMGILSRIGITNKRHIEIGIGNGDECNTANLSLNHGWSGLLIDGDQNQVEAARRFYSHCPGVRVEQCFVTLDNINELFIQYRATGNLDVFSLDIDGNDYWIMERVNVINPRVVILEYNPSFGPERSVSVKYDPNFYRMKYDGSGWYHGASLTALTKLMKRKGYILIGCDSNGYNAFYARLDAAEGALRELSPQEAYYAAKPRFRFGSPETQFSIISSLPLEEIL